MLAFRFYFLALLSLAITFVAACNPLTPPTRADVSVPRQISSIVANGGQLQEVSAPVLSFPPDVYAVQVRKYFQLNDDYFALVLQPSINIPFEPNEPIGTFVGVLHAPAQAESWRKLFFLDASVPGNKNNPYWMWTQDNAMYLAAVDQNGAGSGEGNMKLLKLDDDGNWNLNGCYYFGGSYNGPETGGDYFAHATQLQNQKPLPLEHCAGWGTLRPVKN